MLVASGGTAGKKLAKYLLKEGNWLMHPAPQTIIWYYAKNQPNLLKKLTEILQAIEYVQGIPSEMGSFFDRNTNILIIIDDMMDEAAQDKRISQLFKRRRHGSISVIYLTQYLFHKNEGGSRLTSDYMVVYKNPKYKNQFPDLVKKN